MAYGYRMQVYGHPIGTTICDNGWVAHGGHFLQMELHLPPDGKEWTRGMGGYLTACIARTDKEQKGYYTMTHENLM